MIVLDWIIQILLFFVLWKVFHMATGLVRDAFQSNSLIVNLLVNLVVSILLLIIMYNLHSVWWLMSLVGALVGVITGMSAARVKSSGSDV